MNAKLLAVGVSLVLVCASPVLAAVSITNEDDKDHKVTVIEGDKKSDHVLKPSQVLENICAKGCIIRLNDNDNEDDEYVLDGTEIVAISEGVLYLDGPDNPSAPNVGTDGPKAADPKAAPKAPDPKAGDPKPAEPKK